jgi:hypothetical protein
MKFGTSTKLLLLLPFGVLVYLLNIFSVPLFGMFVSQVFSAVLILILLILYIVLSGRESDERERLLQLQSDSAALYIVLAGLLTATIFYPHSEAAMVFWMVLGLAVIGRLIIFIYKRYS